MAQKIKRRDLTAGEYTGNVVPKPTMWVYSISSMFRDACYALISGFLMNYIMYSGVLSSDATEYSAQINVINVLFIVLLIWDGLNDPLFGLILEKCHLKTGKFRPWILIGGVLNSVVVALLFTIRPHGWGFVAFWAVFYFLWDAVFTLNDIGYWSMLPSLTSDEKTRNRITTIMSIFVSIGSFAMYAICSLLPQAENYTYIYGYIAVPTCILFGLSQIAIFFICKEKKRDPVQEEVSKKTRFRDLFTVLGHNKPLRSSVIAILLYYTGSSLLIGIGTTYFYLIYGYGGDYGGAVATMLTIAYAIGTFASQGLFGYLSKHFSKQRLLTMSVILSVLGYVAFFLVSLPLFGDHPLAYNSDTSATFLSFAFGGTMVLNYIPPIFFFFGQGIFYLVLLLMMQNSIEYNEWKNGERKEAVIFSWRPLDAKLGSAVQKGITALTLTMTGLYGMVTSSISGFETTMAEEISADPTNAATYQAECRTAINNLIANNISRGQLIALGACMIGSVIICLVAAYLVIHFGYNIDEKAYRSIVKDLEVRHAADEKKAALQSAK